MSNDTSTETAEPKNAAAYLLGFVNIALFFVLVYLFLRAFDIWAYVDTMFITPFGIFQSIFDFCSKLFIVWAFFYALYVLGSMFFSVLEKDKDYDWVKVIRTHIANRFPLLLFEIFLIVYAIWIALGVVRFFNRISLDNDSIGSIFIFPIPAILAFSCMIATLTILTSMFSSWLLYPQPQTDPSKRFDNSNSAISRFLSSVKLSFIVEIWRQVAYFMFCITIPLTVIGLYLLHTQPWSNICFCTIESLPILYYILILQIAYIVFNVVMRRLYARIGNLIAARER